jgi:NAD(P)H dehydrogenase (quinone)
MSLAITGASGPLGRHTAELLLDRVDPSDVVLITRRPDSLADLAARGAAVRFGDFTDVDSLASAFAGVDKLLLISTDAVGVRLDQQRGAVAAAANAGIGHVIYTSVPQPTADNPALVVADHAGTEQALRDSGLQWTFLRNNLYAHMQVPGIQQAIATGQVVTNAGDGRTAYVTREDCAAVAAAVLAGEGHAGRTYDVTGSTAFSAADLAALASDIGGRPVDVVHVDDAALIQGMVGAGLPEFVAELLASFGAATRGGFLADVSTTVADLTGQAPRTLADVITAELAATS